MSWPQDTPYTQVAGPFDTLRLAWEAAEKTSVGRNVAVDIVVVSTDEWMRVLTVDPTVEDSPTLLATERAGWAWWVGELPALLEESGRG
ncbi:MAG: hypothetical protein EXR52_00460 [Dehalococcoidia bacterium]|nr:hypothetical protein [Dehalococcoidia bacterium]